jgi:hypothetical protein
MKLSHDYSQKELNDKLVSAAFNNDFPLIKELLTSPKLKLHAEINSDSRFIAMVCSGNNPVSYPHVSKRDNRDILKYIFTSPDLKEHADIHIDNERALCCAVYACDIPMIKYLLTSPDLKEHSNLYYEFFRTDLIFKSIFKVREFAKTDQLVDYFTLDYAIEQKDAKVYLKLFENADNSDSKEQIKNNLMANFLNEKDENHQKELIKVLKKLSPKNYKKIILKTQLEDSLPISNGSTKNKAKI